MHILMVTNNTNIQMKMGYKFCSERDTLHAAHIDASLRMNFNCGW